MTISRELWTDYFTEDNFPQLICSKCGSGIIQLINQTLNRDETALSLKTRREDVDWENEWKQDRYVALLKCNNESCNETFSLTGRSYLEVHMDESDAELNNGPVPIFTQAYYPEYIYPPALVFPIPEKTPEDVRETILQSFSLFMIDPNAAGNIIRSCVEKLLNHQRINKTVIITKRGKRIRKPLPLHNRIDIFRNKNVKLANHLLAIKWLGNNASHSRSLSLNDILDAYEILNHVLDEIYDNKAKALDMMTKTINKRKGKRSNKFGLL
jgi:uncharacterized protein DUF4145